MKNLVESINQRLTNGYIPAKRLLSRFGHVTSSSTRRAFFTDPCYYPFYYYLGNEWNPKSILDMSLGGGLSLGCMLLGTQAAERALGFQKENEDFYSLRMAKHNIRNVFSGKFDAYVGSLNDKPLQSCIKSFSWDAIIINEMLTYDDYLSYMRFLWPHLADKGLVIIDHVNYHKPSGRAYYDFCKMFNRDNWLVDTKYGVGLVQK